MMKSRRYFKAMEPNGRSDGDLIILLPEAAPLPARRPESEGDQKKTYSPRLCAISKYNI